ncbi:hypothetical protein [Segetibacter sp.]|nr:hypothetical protein [Segetibacter sp.]
MKKTTYLYYSPAPSAHGRRQSAIPHWAIDFLKVVLLFLLGFIVSL